MKQISGPNLIILNLQKVHGGQYKCKLVGHRKTSEAILYVRYAPTLLQPKNEGNKCKIISSGIQEN